MIKIAITNQKGGVGKTTTTITLGTILASKGMRVLMVDLDPQGSLTQTLGIAAEKESIADVLGGALEGTATIDEVAKPVRPNLSLVPSNIRLSASEIALVSRMGRESILKKALDELTEYDVVFIDCPPSMGLLTANGLVASHAAIIPSLPSESDLRGVRLLLQTMDRVRDSLNPQIQLLGILIVRFDARTKEHNRILNVIKDEGYPLLGTVPRSVKVQEADSLNKSIIEHAPKGKPSLSYLQVSKAVMKWLNENKPMDELAFLNDL